MFWRMVWRDTLLFSAAGIGVAAVFSLVSPWLVPLLFPKFAGAASVFALDVWRVAGALSCAVFASALICQERRSAFAFCQVSALAAGIVLAALLVPGHGAWGAAAAVVGGRIAFALLALLAFLLGPRAEEAVQI
jgi:O-antigen/teichoic acid export membrane protein